VRAAATTKAWVGTGLVDLEEAGVAVDDRGLTTGDGCFETMKVIGGTPFALTRHLGRLARSCDALGIDTPDGGLVRDACAAVVAANGDGVGRVRVTVTAGRAPIGPARGDGEPVLLVTSGPPRQLAPTARVATCPWTRNERSALAGIKATSYGENVIAARWAAERGCDEALFANTRGELCEGTGSNVFVVLDGVLRTPPLAAGCLAGVTRELVCELVDVDEAPLPITDLAAATEAFLTSSTRDVHPIAELDGRELPGPGPRTAAIAGEWAALVARTLDP
jgi:branched-chain amino acid aminotransferase